jgi:hypothetical protein
MYPFLQPPTPAEYDGLSLRQTPSYTEIISSVAGGSREDLSCCYVLRNDDATYAAVTCWQNTFDVFYQQLMTKYGQIYLDAIKETWPILWAVISNSINQRYGDGALLELVDPDDMNRKWFVGVLVGNIEDPKSPADHPRIVQAVQQVSDISLQIHRERITRTMSFRTKAKIGLRGAMVGYLEGQALSDRLESKLQWFSGSS